MWVIQNVRLFISNRFGDKCKFKCFEIFGKFRKFGNCFLRFRPVGEVTILGKLTFFGKNASTPYQVVIYFCGDYAPYSR